MDIESLFLRFWWFFEVEELFVMVLFSIVFVFYVGWVVIIFSFWGVGDIEGREGGSC